MLEFEILEAAKADVLNGWCVNILEDNQGNVCALGAINKAVSGDANEFESMWNEEAPYKRVEKMLEERGHAYGIAYWNNYEAGSAAVVAALLQEAADQARTERGATPVPIDA